MNNFCQLACQPPLRWRNYQSSLARLTTLDLINCGFLSSLEHLLPYSREYPDLNKRPLDGPNKIGNYLIGAAQWIIYPHEGQYVYEQCCKKGEKVSGENPREMWCMERWREWKGQFAFVAGDERFQGKYREMAKVAYEKMLEYEEGH